MRLVDHVYDDQVIDSLTVRIILPEGARSVLVRRSVTGCFLHLQQLTIFFSLPFQIRTIHVDTPYKIDRMPNQLHYTYLDTFGRPVLVATKNNLVEHHIQDVVVR